VVVAKVGKEGDCSNNYTCSNFLLFGRKHGTRHLGSAGRFTAHSPIINVTDKSTTPPADDYSRGTGKTVADASDCDEAPFSLLSLSIKAGLVRGSYGTPSLPRTLIACFSAPTHGLRPRPPLTLAPSPSPSPSLFHCHAGIQKPFVHVPDPTQLIEGASRVDRLQCVPASVIRA